MSKRKNEITKTERGEVDTKVEEDNFSVSVIHELKQIDWQEGDEDIKEVIGKVLEMDFSSPYAETYQENLKESYVLYGRDGVKTQLLYLMANLDEESESGKMKTIEKLKDEL